MPVEPKCLVLQRSQCRAPVEAIMERQCSAVQYSMPNTLQLNSGRALKEKNGQKSLVVNPSELQLNFGCEHWYRLTIENPNRDNW